MLQELFGSKSVERILLFLLVNERCYATQIHKVLEAPLTPLQKALERLEKGGIVKSLYEGKTRLYELNASYPLINELETLLKRAYGSLCPQEKKKYYYVKDQSEKGDQKVLLAFWDLLKKVSSLHFVAKSHSKNGKGWKGSGRGDVEVSYDGDATLIFTESGVRTNEEEKGIEFTNTFRWTLHRLDGLIGLEHLRYGKMRPVFMFHLRAAGRNCLESVYSHECQQDSYFGAVHLKQGEIRLTWRIIGPHKNEELEYIYT